MSTQQLKVMAKRGIPKCPTGIPGLDQITEGGLPKGRPTLLCGTAGCGKTVLAMEFLARGAVEFNEPGVFLAFEETDKELSQNVASMGFDLPALCARKKLVVDYVRIERSEIEETGEYDLEGLFIRLGDRCHWREARGSRHHRSSVLGVHGHQHSARGTAAAVPMAEGAGSHSGHHRGERRRETDSGRH